MHIITISRCEMCFKYNILMLGVQYFTIVQAIKMCKKNQSFNVTYYLRYNLVPNNGNNYLNSISENYNLC